MIINKNHPLCTGVHNITGKFPKAFDMDANFITDSEAIMLLLETLQPIANSVHICIIGAGDQVTLAKANTFTTIYYTL